MADPTFEPGTLWARLCERSERALGRGALHPIPTDFQFVEQDGIRFLVRVLTNLARKEAAQRKQARQGEAAGWEINPFLPYDEDMFVAGVSDSHLCLLNKFNVVEHHLLIVTRAFEDQETLLDQADFEALWACLAEFEGLAFYNGGSAAGASQRHKHLQIVPLPLAPDGPRIPIEAALAGCRWRDGIGVAPGLPFRHALARLNPELPARSPQAGAALLSAYRALLGIVGMDPEASKQSAPYNLLATREWMLLVPRARERFESISINALGFAGALLVRDEEQLALIKRSGPMTALRAAALPSA